MGVQNSSLSQMQALGRGNQRSLQNIYYTQIYLSHKKNMAQFKQALTSIIKRSSYLHYSWTQQLLDLLRNTSKDHLYHQYKAVLKENCLPTGHHPQTFYASQTREFFRASFDRHQHQLTISPGFERLLALAEECKAFLMVMAWLHQLTELESHPQDQSFQESRARWDQGEEESVCSRLLVVAQRYFEALLQEYPREHRIPAKLQHNIMVLLRSLKRKSSFVDKEAAMKVLEGSLSEQPSQFKKQFEDISEVLGKTVVFAHIFVAREMVGSKFSKSWQVIQPFVRPF